LSLSVQDCVEKLKRARTIVACLGAIDLSDVHDFVYLEIGTCFKEDEGLSTYVAARFLAEAGQAGRVFSHEMKPEHIAASKEIVRRYDSTLLDRITWVEGNSAFTVPQTLAQLDEVNLAFIDGGGHPLYNLFEFQVLWEKLSPGGLILVDDCNYLPPSPAYQGRRDYGKAQLILPFLMLQEYLGFQTGVAAGQLNAAPDDQRVIDSLAGLPVMTPFMRQVFQETTFQDIASDFQDMDFAFVADGTQLVVGRKAAMARLRDGNPSTSLRL